MFVLLAPMNAKPKRTQVARRAETRRALLQAVVDCLLDYGYQKTTLAAIARKAGLTTGAVQHHFQSRNELMQAAIEEYLFTTDPINLDAHTKDSLADRCMLLVKSYWQYFSNPRYMALWEIILAARHDEQLMSKIKAWQARSVRNAEKFLPQLFPEFDLSADKIKSVQYFVTAQLRGLALLTSVDDRRPKMPEQLCLLAEALEQTLGRH